MASIAATYEFPGRQSRVWRDRTAVGRVRGSRGTVPWWQKGLGRDWQPLRGQLVSKVWNNIPEQESRAGRRGRGSMRF